jgi:uncharacterized protein (DUF362 family)
MSLIYRRKADERADFIRRVLEIFSPGIKASRRVLVKPNVVSAEPYPTTTSPEVLEAVLAGLRNMRKEIIVADEPAVDARKKAALFGSLAAVCRKFGLRLESLSSGGTVRARTSRPGAPAYRLYRLALECDYRISLPVLKVHRLKSIGFTGALKNQFAFLATAERIACHLGLRDIHRAIVDANLIARVHLVVMDAVEILVGANERRHGGRPAKLRTLLAGDDPVALDCLGFTLLAGTGEPKLVGRTAADIRYLQRAVEFGLGSDSFRIEDL